MKQALQDELVPVTLAIMLIFTVTIQQVVSQMHRMFFPVLEPRLEKFYTLVSLSLQQQKVAVLLCGRHSLTSR